MSSITRSSIWGTTVMSLAFALAIPCASRAAAGDADANAVEVESEGSERIVERMRWFREGRLGADGEIPLDARNRAFREVEENIRRKILGPQPANLIPGDGWSPIGPSPMVDVSVASHFSGRVTAIAIHPTVGNTAYIGSAQGGVWKSIDHGVTWTPKTDTQASLAIGSVAIDRLNPNVIYAGTGEANGACGNYFGAGILKSTDAGTSWSLIAANPFANSSISKIIVHPANSTILWAANTPGTAGFVCSSANAAAAVGVWKSIDSGMTWTRTLSSIQVGSEAYTTDLVMNPTNANVLYASVRNSGIWRSIDGGLNWTRFSNGLPVPGVIGRVAMAIHPTTPTIMYALFEDSSNGRQYGGTYKSTDGGATWNLLPASKQTGNCQVWNFSDVCTYSTGGGGQCWYDLVIGVAADGGVWAGGTGLWRSGDGGTTWNAVCSPQVHTDQHALAFRGSDVWLGNDGGVFTTANLGANWTDRNTGLALTQFYPGGALHPTDASVALGGAQDNGTMSYSGSSQWLAERTGDGASQAFDLTSPDTDWYTSWQYLSIQKSIDSGVSWFNATSGLTDATTANANFIAPFIMCPHDAQVLVAGSDNVWRTNNGAGLWTANSPDPLDSFAPWTRITTLAFASSTGDCSTYFAGNSWGRLFVTSNSGASWTDITGNLPGSPISDVAVDPTDASVVIVALSGFGPRHVWRTTNALAPFPSWSAIDPGIPDVPVNTVLIDPTAPSVLYLGTDVGIFRSTNGGADWHVFMGGHPNVAVYDLVANAATETIISFTHGRSAFKLGTFCSDGDACTTDTFDQLLGCQHAPVTCDDGDSCTIDTCVSGICAGIPTPALAVNGSVRVAKIGTDVEVSWIDPPGPFDVYRGIRTDPTWTYNQTCFGFDVPGPVTDVDIPLPGETTYYLVTRNGVCGESSLGDGRGPGGTPLPRPNLSPCP